MFNFLVSRKRALGLFRAFLTFCLAMLIGIPQAFSQQNIICRKDKSDDRHFVVEIENLDRGVPCSVIDVTNSESPKVMWRAEYERDFCWKKMREVLGRLTAQGWKCVSTLDLNSLEPVM